MGTPEFAVASLDALVRAGQNVVAVVTAPDKPAGRGMKLNDSAVKKYAVEKGIPVLQPIKLKDPDFIAALKDFKPDLQVIVAFRMLPEVVWSLPPMGTVNLHGSLLPEYRGAAPINWAIINGEKETGVTTFKLRHEIDTGNIFMQKVIPIGDDETAGELHDRMKVIGADLLVDTVKALNEGYVVEIPQTTPDPFDQTGLKHAPKIFTSTCKIDWSKNMDEVYNLIRGLSPYPGAFTKLEGKLFKIFKVIKQQENPKSSPGGIETDGKTFLRFACKNGYISVTEIQLEGKKKMSIADFLRGHSI